MHNFTIHGSPATITTANRWRCNDKFVERFLNDQCVGADVDTSVAAAQAQFGDAMQPGDSEAAA